MKKILFFFLVILCFTNKNAYCFSFNLFLHNETDRPIKLKPGGSDKWKLLDFGKELLIPPHDYIHVETGMAWWSNQGIGGMDVYGFGSNPNAPKHIEAYINYGHSVLKNISTRASVQVIQEHLRIVFTYNLGSSDDDIETALPHINPTGVAEGHIFFKKHAECVTK